MLGTWTFGQAALVSPSNKGRKFIRTLLLCGYLAGDALDSDDSDDDDQPLRCIRGQLRRRSERKPPKENWTRCSPHFRTAARSLQRERPRQVTPKFGNTNQKPLEQTLPQSQPQRKDRQAFPCLEAGCDKILKSLGGPCETSARC